MNVLAQHPWIISRRWDLAFFIASPVLCLAAILPLRAVLPSDQIALYLLALFATGHHLPGFMRIYGDPLLFRRYPARFLLAPPLVFAAALWFADQNLHGLILITALWDLWHSFMQHYGFMRIYAAKTGETSAALSRLDLWLSLCWFVTVTVLSPAYSLSLIRPMVQTFGIEPSAGALTALRWVAIAATAVVTAAYAITTIRAWRAGVRVSSLKLVLLVTTIAFIALVWWLLDDLVLGYAIWAVFHDVQYFAIVWIYSRGLIKQDGESRPMLRFLFQRKLAIIALYVVLIFLYGSMSIWQDGMAGSPWRTMLGAFIATSTLLHYYFDGFIWKVRERATREALAVTDATGASSPSPSKPRSERLVLHLAAFAVPFGLCLWFEPTSRSGDHVYRALVSIYPGWGDVQFKLGDELAEQGKLEEAAGAYHAGLEQQPDAPLAHRNLASIYLRLARPEWAHYHLQRAAALKPRDLDLQDALARMAGQPSSSRCCTREPAGRPQQ